MIWTEGYPLTLGLCPERLDTGCHGQNTLDTRYTSNSYYYGILSSIRSNRESHMKRLSPSRVSEIRKYWSAGYTIRHLARYFSLAESTVSGVVHRKTHRRVNAHSDLPPLPDPAHPQLVHSNRCIDRLKSGEEHSHCECSCHSWPSDVSTLRQCAKLKKEGEKHQGCECHCHGDQEGAPGAERNRPRRPGQEPLGSLSVHNAVQGDHARGPRTHG